MEKRIGKNKLASAAILACAALAIFSGCGKKEGEPVYGLFPVEEQSLQAGRYYVKSGDAFYELPSPEGRNTFEEGLLTAKEASPERNLLFTGDDASIPTMYRDDMLIYVAEETIPPAFVWERFEDNGYSIGAVGLKEGAGKYSFEKGSGTVRPGSSFAEALEDIPDGQGINIDRVNGAALTNVAVSRGGSITGLTYGQRYSVDAYAGSRYIEAEAVADTHIFTSFELYETSIYNFAQSDYVVVDIPAYYRSGYYLVNGAGFVKYVDALKAEGVSGVNFNAPYYLYDEDGNVYTADEAGEGEDSQEGGGGQQGSVYESAIALDCTNEKMTVTIDYSEIISAVNGVELNLSDGILESMEGREPSAVIAGPDGEEYVFNPSYTHKNQLQCVVPMPLAGLWTVRMAGMDLRSFHVGYELTSGHSDSMNLTGEGKASMAYYLDQSMDDAVFYLSWTNAERDGKVLIETPDGRKIGKEEDESCILGEGYGYKRILVEDAAFGEYKITVEGDNLGHVRTVVEDYMPEGETGEVGTEATTETEEALGETEMGKGGAGTAASEAETEAGSGTEPAGL